MTPDTAAKLAEAGPWAVVLFIGGILAVVLWRDHLRGDAEDRKQRDDALADLRTQAAAYNKGTEAQTELAKQVGALAGEVGTAVKGVAAIRRDLGGRRE